MQNDGEQWVITTPTDALDTVRDALTAASIPVLTADFARIPKTPKVLSGRDAEVGMSLVETLEDHDDVQKVHIDFEPSDEALASHS